MKIIIWKNHNNNKFYYKVVRGWYADYEIGYFNKYNHEVVFIIENVYFEKNKIPLKKRLLRKYISFLEKQLKK